MSKKSIAIDLDGTLTSWEPNSDQPNGIGEWLPGAQEAIDTFLQLGFRVIIHTCRATWEAGGSYTGVRKFFDDAGYLEPDVIVWHEVGKPIASFYIDDRAVPFKGNWPSVVGSVMLALGDKYVAIPDPE